MKKIDEYVATILTSDLTDEEKIEYLKNLNVIHKLNLPQIQVLEDKVYELDNQRITEKEKIIYEANFLYAHYKKNGLDLSDIRKLYYKIRKYSSSEEEIDKIKMHITQLQLNNGLTIRFYKAYLDLLDKMKKENTEKTGRTFHK